MSEDWHVPPARLAAYAAGRADDADAWSTEAHVTACPPCRTELAAALAGQGPGPALAVLEGVRRRVLADPPAPAVPLGRRTARWGARRPRVHAAWLARPLSLAAVLLAVLAAVGLALSARAGLVTDSAGSAVLLWLLAPLVPLAGVALCSAGDGDPWREVLLSTPSAGLRLVLWRTATVLAVAVPAALGAGALVDATGSPPAPGAAAGSAQWPVLWLLPCLGLTATTLAAGTVVPLGRAAALVAALWCAAVAGPAVAAVGADVRGVVAHLAAAAPGTGDLPLVTGTGAQAAWAALAVVAAALAVARRRSYEQLPPAAGRRPA